MSKRISNVFAFIIISLTSFAQSKEIKHYVIIPNNLDIYMEKTVSSADTTTVNPNSILTTEKDIIVGGQKMHLQHLDTVRTTRTIYGSKKITYMGNLGGKANIYLDKDDPSILRINYWLGSGYSQDGTYWIKLKNRQSVRIKFRTWEAGALTIPFKIRPGRSVDLNSKPSTVETNINLGFYAGRAIGSYKYWYRTGFGTQIDKRAIQIGGFFGSSTQTLNATTTSLDPEPYTNETTILVFSSGLGLHFHFYDFRIGLFSGKDWSFGDNARKWNYQGQLWFGFGVGYNLGFLQFKSN